MLFNRVLVSIPAVAAAILMPGLSTGALAQAPSPVQQNVQSEADGNGPVFRIEVVDRSISAINYQHRNGSTTINFAGTPLLPEANGEAKVESKQGYIEIEVEFDELKPATQFGPEYLTYVMWAITPEGRATNLGEVLLNGNRSKLNVTTELQSFGLLMTAEPHFAVSQPSDVVVLENIVRGDTRGKVEVVDAKYELLKRGTYAWNVGQDAATARAVNPNMPLEIYEAHNAVQLARFANADTYASETYQKALAAVRQAEEYLKNPNNRGPAVALAREAVQTAADARLIAIERAQAAALTDERRAAAEATAEASRNAALAESRAQTEASRRQAAETEASRLAAAKSDAERAQANAEKARAEAEAAQRAAAAEADRLAGEREKAEAARVAALQAQRAAEQETLLARNAAAQAESDRNALRGQLQQQLNVVMETKQTARGLIVNMPDVLFDIDQATLKPDAREKLARVAGILMAHPELELDLRAEGHTDSTGTDEYNQQLSEKRAGAVHAYLATQGLNEQNIQSAGFGESKPVASNDTSAGRKQNRRVELVISGEAIATIQ